LMFVRLATLRGATVVSVDQSAWRLDQARSQGAAATINISGLEPDERNAAIRRATPHGRGADIGIEAVGLGLVWEQTVETIRPGGSAVWFGGTPKGDIVTIDSSRVHYEELQMKGVFHHAPRY